MGAPNGEWGESLPVLPTRVVDANASAPETPALDSWKRTFLAVWPGLFAVSAGVSAVLPGLPLYIEEAFGVRDPEAVRCWTGLVFGAGPFFAAVMGPFWGSLADRFGRRAMVLRSMLAIAVVNALMPFATS